MDLFSPLPSIMIVDDEPDIAEIVAYSVASSSNGAPTICTDPLEALRFLEEGRAKPDIILLDYRMPGKNGFEFVRALPAAAMPVQIILLSGAVDKRVAVEAVSLKIYGILEKPANSEVLNTLIASAYNHQKALKLNLALIEQTSALNTQLSEALENVEANLQYIENAWIEKEGKPIPEAQQTLHYLHQKKQQRLKFGKIREIIEKLEQIKKASNA